MNPTVPIITNRICFVGSGECKNTATHEVDDGTGKSVYICAHHLEEFELMEEIFSKLPPEKLIRLEQAITKAENKKI